MCTIQGCLGKGRNNGKGQHGGGGHTTCAEDAHARTHTHPRALRRQTELTLSSTLMLNMHTRTHARTHLPTHPNTHTHTHTARDPQTGHDTDACAHGGGDVYARVHVHRRRQQDSGRREGDGVRGDASLRCVRIASCVHAKCALWVCVWREHMSCGTCKVRALCVKRTHVLLERLIKMCGGAIHARVHVHRWRQQDSGWREGDGVRGNARLRCVRIASCVHVNCALWVCVWREHMSCGTRKVRASSVAREHRV